MKIPEKIHITLVDDHQLFRKGIAAMLQPFGDIEIVFESGSAQEFLDWLRQDVIPPEVILLDIEMPGMNGIELMKKLRSDYPAIKVIILSMHFRQSVVAGLVENGVSGYLSKNCEPTELHNAITIVMRSDFYFSEEVLRIMHRTLAGQRKKAADTTLGFDITAREKEVIGLICRENTTAEIAEKLFISMRTVEGHRINLLQKTGAKNSAGLVFFAIRNNLIDLWF
jgi:DNA-binding NarL/FixJ family response regulator